MARLKSMKSIDDKIFEYEEKLRKLKERCDKLEYSATSVLPIREMIPMTR